MSDIVAELRRLYEASTAGPWVHDIDLHDGRLRGDVLWPSGERGLLVLMGCGMHARVSRPQSEIVANADLIVAMHNHLPALLGVVGAARAHLTGLDVMGDEYLCLALGRLDGRDDHDWSEWEAPMEGATGWWRFRRCQACGARQAEEVPPPADDLRERVLIAQLPEDEEGAE